LSIYKQASKKRKAKMNTKVKKIITNLLNLNLATIIKWLANINKRKLAHGYIILIFFSMFMNTSEGDMYLIYVLMSLSLLPICLSELIVNSVDLLGVKI
jgi:hypothetical protein